MGNGICARFVTKNLQLPDDEDAWKRQTTGGRGKENILYELVDVKVEHCSGKLLEIYKISGSDGLIKALDDGLIRDYLYESRKIIGKQDLVDWARSRKLPLSFYEHVDYPNSEACWNLNYRGALGETALHLCFLNNKLEHTAIAKILLKKYPALALDRYENEEFFGETAVHIVIVNNDFESLKLMISICGADIHARASGKFFLPEDSKEEICEESDYNGYAYYGEYPLSFAASLRREEMYDYLIYKGADPNKQDILGNTVLHLCVIYNNVEMFNSVMHPRQIKKPDPGIRNEQGLTALGLACKLGRKDMFEALLEMTGVVHWCYGKIECSAYPLEGLDSISSAGKPDWDSGLYIATAGKTDEHMELMGSGIMFRLLDEKWQLFAKRKFYIRFMFAIFHLIIFSIAIFLRPNDFKAYNYPSDRDKVRLVAEIITVLMAIIYIVMEMKHICSIGLFGFLRSMLDDAGKTCFQISCVLIILAVPCHFLHVPTETRLLIVAAPLAWSYMLFFLRGLGSIGPFIDMIYKMLAGDMSRFVIIYIIFLVGLTQGFHHVMKDAKDDDGNPHEGFENEAHSLMSCIHMSFGEFDFFAFDKAKYPKLAKILFFYFMALVSILLLNMLIAMMASTYQEIADRSEKEWRRQWAHIILVLERSMKPAELIKIQDQYTVSMNNEVRSRGIMVIKKISKAHRAVKRQIAVANWKILGIGTTKKRLQQQAAKNYPKAQGRRVAPAV